MVGTGDTGKKLRQSVLHDIKEPLLLAGYKVLGLLSKTFSAPLWHILEHKTHILEMNNHYESMMDFLQKIIQDPDMFLKGTESPLGNDLINKDELFEAFVEPVEELNNRVVQIVPPVAQALNELPERMVADHLPGGRFLTVTEALQDTADSVVPCNKVLEVCFGVLDYQL